MTKAMVLMVRTIIGKILRLRVRAIRMKVKMGQLIITMGQGIIIMQAIIAMEKSIRVILKVTVRALKKVSCKANTKVHIMVVEFIITHIHRTLIIVVE